MNKAILISIRPKHAVKILNGEKTLELRKSVPKDFAGWVYIYVTKAKELNFNAYENQWEYNHPLDKKLINPSIYNVNQKVVARFWFDEHDKITNGGSRFYVKGKDIGYTNLLAKKSCLDFTDLKKYADDKDLYAWHIKQLEILTEPIELSKFYTYKKRYIDCGRDCPPYWDDVKTPVRKAPQSWQYVYPEGE